MEEPWAVLAHAELGDREQKNTKEILINNECFRRSSLNSVVDFLCEIDNLRWRQKVITFCSCGPDSLLIGLIVWGVNDRSRQPLVKIEINVFFSWETKSVCTTHRSRRPN